MKIFISHSSRDAKVAAALVDLLRSALNLRSDEIRCTSIEGYRLEAGTSTDETLRREVHDAELFLGLITPSSIKSTYVMFELGARWGAGRTLIPLLSSGADSTHLRGPLAGINALDCAIREQAFQLVDDAAAYLSITPSSPAAYAKPLDALVSASTADAQVPVSTEARPRAPALSQDVEDIVLKVLGIAANEHTMIYFPALRYELNTDVTRAMAILARMTEEGLIRQTPSDSYELTDHGAWVAVDRNLV